MSAENTTDEADAYRAALEDAAAECEARIYQISIPERWSAADHALADAAAAIRALAPKEAA